MRFVLTITSCLNPVSLGFDFCFGYYEQTDRYVISEEQFNLVLQTDMWPAIYKPTVALCYGTVTGSYIL